MTERRAKRPRRYVRIREYWAAALSMLLPQEQRDELRAAKVPAKTVIALFNQDHNILHALNGEDRWWNFTPLLRAAHKEKSRKDTGVVYKSDRLVESQREHLARMAAKILPRAPSVSKPKSRLQGRPFSKERRPMQSSGFDRRRQ